VAPPPRPSYSNSTGTGTPYFSRYYIFGYCAPFLKTGNIDTVCTRCTVQKRRSWEYLHEACTTFCKTEMPVKVSQVLVGFAVLCVVVLLILTRANKSKLDAAHIQREDLNQVKLLMELVKIQNETIHTLENHLKHSILKKGDDKKFLLAEDKKLIEISDTIARLSEENRLHQETVAKCMNASVEQQHTFDFEMMQHKANAAVSSLVPEVFAKPEPVECPVCASTRDSNPAVSQRKSYYTKMEKECEFRYGMELVDRWKSHREVWCADETAEQDPAHKSELICYPYHQEHKKLDGRGSDLICEATNFVLDFPKVASLSVSVHSYSLTYCVWFLF
jgi:hypothetical protein